MQNWKEAESMFFETCLLSQKFELICWQLKQKKAIVGDNYVFSKTWFFASPYFIPGRSQIDYDAFETIFEDSF